MERIVGYDMGATVRDCGPRRQWSKKIRGMGSTKGGTDCGVPDGPNFGTWILLMWISEERIRLPFGRITTPKIRDEGCTGCIA